MPAAPTPVIAARSCSRRRTIARAAARLRRDAPTADDPPMHRSGGAPVVAMDNIAPRRPASRVAKGPRRDRPLGRGGTGTGTGSGVGSGCGRCAAPISVADDQEARDAQGRLTATSTPARTTRPRPSSSGIEGVMRVRLVVDDDGHGEVGDAPAQPARPRPRRARARARPSRSSSSPARDTDDKPVTLGRRVDLQHDAAEVAGRPGTLNYPATCGPG